MNRKNRMTPATHRKARQIIVDVALGVSLLGSLAAHAQITMENRPFRAQAPAPQAAMPPVARAQAADADDLPIDMPINGPAPATAPAGAVPSATTRGAVASVLAPAPVSTRATPVWTILPTDGFVSRALARWASTGSANGESTLPILWNAPKDLPAVRAQYTGDFLTALEQVMVDSRNGDYPIHACAYDNLVRVLHTSQPCSRASSAARAQ